MKRLAQIITLLACLGAVSVACVEEIPEETPEFSVTPGSVSQEAAGGPVELQIKSNTDWTADSNEGWITVTPKSGNGDGVVSLSIQANVAAEGARAAARTGKVTFQYAGKTVTVEVIQEPEALVFVALGETTEVDYKQTKVVVKVSHNVGYEVTVPQDAEWITREAGTKAAVTDDITFSVAKNRGEAREATITFTPAEGETKTVVIKQGKYEGLAPDGALEGQFSVSASKKVFFADGNLQTDLTYKNPAFAANQYDVLGNDAEKTDLFDYAKIATVLPQGWTVLTKEEWIYLLSGREGAADKAKAATVADTYGYVIVPDECTKAISGTYTVAEWAAFENANNAVFLPAAGYSYGTAVAGYGEGGSYWTLTEGEEGQAFSVDFDATALYVGGISFKAIGQAVRPVVEVKK